MVTVDRRVVLTEYVAVGDRIAVFGARADWAAPQVAVVDVDPAELALFVTANFDSYRSIRELAEMPELWHGYDRLVAPLTGWSDPGDVVCLVPYGALHSLPLHALRVDGRYLIERNPLVYVPSAAALRHSQSGRRPPVAGERRRAAVFGDSRQNLPYAESEALMLGELFGVEPRLGDAVTRKDVLAALAEVDIVHVAGHAGFDAADPLRSGVQLAGTDVLTAADVFGAAGLRASLVTLSGCETGVSHRQPGDELIGLTRAFLSARATSVLVSLWSVADDSTAYFMRRFYEHLLRAPDTWKADAFRTAVLDTMSVSGWDSIYHWAPFVLVGDWR
ncbi:CHAT domain-containing protein [Micromonospora sp. NPDC050397]|uniref:CHAT domain-containing protein n=1 Tax=Micromonospora sp. NPDC050397 TaxID=3364279 RepID=UPI003850603F